MQSTAKQSTDEERRERHEIEDGIRRFFAEKEELAAVYLFGTAARDRLRAESDVDVAVLFSEDPPRTLDGLHLGWARELKRLVGRPVDLVILNFAGAELAYHVRRDGGLLVENDAEARVLWEVASRNEYFDLLPILRRCRDPETNG